MLKGNRVYHIPVVCLMAVFYDMRDYVFPDVNSDNALDTSFEQTDKSLADMVRAPQKMRLLKE